MKNFDYKPDKKLSNGLSSLLFGVEGFMIKNKVFAIETTTKFDFNLGFAKVSRSIKKIKK